MPQTGCLIHSVILLMIKYADCNGDGVVNANDTTAIVANYGLTHAKTNGGNAPWRSGIPGLSLHFSKDTLNDGDSLTVSIMLGDSGTVVRNIYGLSFALNYNPTYVDLNYAVSFQFLSSWLGNASNSMSLTRMSFPTAQVLAAITGIDHVSRSGYGEIARFKYIVNTHDVQNHNVQHLSNVMYISGLTSIDRNGQHLTINTGTDSNVVVSQPNGITELNNVRNLRLYPNPANDKVQIISSTGMKEIQLINTLGQIVKVQRSNNKLSETLDISSLESGIYFVQVSGSNGNSTAKLLVRR